MKTFITAVLFALFLGTFGCASELETYPHTKDGKRIATSDGLPPGWVPWSAYTFESPTPAGTTACGHECPGGYVHTWTYRACGSSTDDGNGNVSINVDWNCFEPLEPAWKECFVTKPDLQHQASIEFQTSTDEARCAYLRDFWLDYRDKNPSGI